MAATAVVSMVAGAAAATVPLALPFLAVGGQEAFEVQPTVGPLVGDPSEPADDATRLVVSLGSVESPAAVAALEAVTGTLDVTDLGGGWYAVRTTEPSQAEARAAYRVVPGVASVEEDIVLSISEDPGLADQWHLRNDGRTVEGLAGAVGADVGAEDAWQVADGSGVVVAVVDTGMEVTHPDLHGQIWQNDGEVCGNRVDDDSNGFVDDCAGWDFLRGDPTVGDAGPGIDNRHATHIAGTIAAARDNGIGVSGLAPGARIMPLKVSDTGSLSLSTAATAIRYAVDNGAHIVSCSFGTSAGASPAQVAPLQDAIRHAGAHGVLVVAAAGNDGRDIDALPTYPASFADDNLISVGASTNADTRASFSNWGATSVDLFAPGWSVVATLPGGAYGGMHGTSMATPLVASGAALVMQAHPGSSVSYVKQALLAQSKAAAAFAGRSVSGRRLDVGLILNPTGEAAVDPVRFSFDGFGEAHAGEDVAATVRPIIDPAVVPAGDRVQVVATLLTDHDGAAHGVSGAPIATDAGVVHTGDDARAMLTAPAGLPAGATGAALQAGFELPAGDYAMVVEARAAEAGRRLGRRWMAFFTVTAPGEVAPPVEVEPLPDGGAGDDPPPAGQPPAVQPPADAPDTSPPPAPVPTPNPTPTPGDAPQWTPDDTPPPAWTPSPQPTYPTYPPPPWSFPWPHWELPWPEWIWSPAPQPAPAPAPSPPAWQPSPTPAPSQDPPTWDPAEDGPQAPPPAVQLPPAPGPVADGPLVVASLDPRYGTVDGGTRVRIDGAGFGATTRVRFGSTPAEAVTVVSDRVLLVTTPRHVSAGPVDVHVSSSTRSVVVPQGFTYVRPASGGTPAPVAPAPGGGPEPEAGAPAPAPDPVAPDAPEDPDPTPAEPGIDPVDEDDALRFGEVIAHRDGLDLRPLLLPSSLDAFPSSGWSARRCASSPCTGTRI